MGLNDSRVEVSFSVQARRDIDHLRQAILSLKEKPAEEFHDDQTMVKVHKAIADAYPGPDDPETMAFNIVGALQNAGILFRERRPS